MEGSPFDGQESEQGDLLVIVMSFEKRWLSEFHVQGDFSSAIRSFSVGWTPHRKSIGVSLEMTGLVGIKGGVQNTVVCIIQSNAANMNNSIAALQLTMLLGWVLCAALPNRKHIVILTEGVCFARAEGSPCYRQEL